MVYLETLVWLHNLLVSSLPLCLVISVFQSVCVYHPCITVNCQVFFIYMMQIGFTESLLSFQLGHLIFLLLLCFPTLLS